MVHPRSVSFSSPNTSDSPSEISDAGGAESTPHLKNSVKLRFSQDDGASKTKSNPPLSCFEHPRSAREKKKIHTGGRRRRSRKIPHLEEDPQEMTIDQYRLPPTLSICQIFLTDSDLSFLSRGLYFAPIFYFNVFSTLHDCQIH